MTVRDRVKSVTPEFIRRILRCILNYVCRLGRWVIILWQIRGAKIADEGVLWVSAFVAPVTSLSNLGGWQDPVLLWDATLNVQGFGVFRVRARTDDLWHVLPWRERRLFRVIRKFLGEGDVFVDAGANIGVFSVLASLIVGGGGRVFAIEMMPDTARILKSHLDMNGCRNVSVLEFALSDADGEKVTATVPRGKYGQASIARSHADAAETVDVTTARLDGLLLHVPSIKMMKVDLEGAELGAFQGGIDALAKTSAVIYEDNSRDRNVSASLTAFLQEQGFQVREIDGNNRLAVRVLDDLGRCLA